MKKKPLLFALLALAIVTSLTAGTLAIYTKKVELAGDVEIKRFAFSAKGGTDTTVKPVKLAPKEAMTTGFTVTNSENGSPPAEVDLNYQITVNIEETAKKMDGLRAELLDKNGTPLNVLGNATGTQFTYRSKLVAGADPQVDEYQVKLTWEHVEGKDAEQTAVGTAAQTFKEGLKITVVATQATN